MCRGRGSRTRAGHRSHCPNQSSSESTTSDGLSMLKLISGAALVSTVTPELAEQSTWSKSQPAGSVSSVTVYPLPGSTESVYAFDWPWPSVNVLPVAGSVENDFV